MHFCFIPKLPSRNYEGNNKHVQACVRQSDDVAECNDGQRRKKKIEIPRSLIEQYHLQTGCQVGVNCPSATIDDDDRWVTTNINKPGIHAETSNVVRTFEGSQLKYLSNSQAETLFGFDFVVEPYARISRDGEKEGADAEDKETVHSAQLEVYWKPQLSIIRKHGSFKASVYDLIKTDFDADSQNKHEKQQQNHDLSMQITMQLDIKKIPHRNASHDEGTTMII